MLIQLTSPHFDLTESLRGYTNTAVDKFEKIHPDKCSIRVVLDKSPQHKTKCTVHYVCTRGAIESSATGEDLYLVIDKAFKKLGAQVQKTHDKKVDSYKK